MKGSNRTGLSHIGRIGMDDNWEYMGKSTDRLWMPDGWLIRTHTFNPSGGVHIIFYFDPDHIWKNDNAKNRDL